MRYKETDKTEVQIDKERPEKGKVRMYEERECRKET